MKNKSVTKTTKDFVDLSLREHSLEEVLELAGIKPEPQVDLNGKEEYELKHPKAHDNFCPKCGLELSTSENTYGNVVFQRVMSCDHCGYVKIL